MSEQQPIIGAEATDLRLQLTQLKADADAALADAVALGQDHFKGDPINWGDLGVTAVEATLTLDHLEGEVYTGWRVCIEEADPYCPILREEVYDRLKAKGWNDVEVVTEW